jgi:hypothetical protein
MKQKSKRNPLNGVVFPVLCFCLAWSGAFASAQSKSFSDPELGTVSQMRLRVPFRFLPDELMQIMFDSETDQAIVGVSCIFGLNDVQKGLIARTGPQKGDRAISLRGQRAKNPLSDTDRKQIQVVRDFMLEVATQLEPGTAASVNQLEIQRPEKAGDSGPDILADLSRFNPFDKAQAVIAFEDFDSAIKHLYQFCRHAK